MFRAAAQVVSQLLGLAPPGRSVVVNESDAFIVSYPKSGNTWVRFLLANLIAPGRPVDFSSVHGIIPDIYRARALDLRATAAPRLLKSHEYFDPRYRRAVYVVRDPRDVVISYYHHHRRQETMPGSFSMERYVRRFIAGELDAYGSWRDHVGSWLGARRHHPGFLLVRYEDLSAAPERELRRMIDFLQLPCHKQSLADVIERCSFEEMRRLERFQVEITRTLEPRRARMPFVRSAKVGGWTVELDPKLAGCIVEAWGEAMADLGYV